MTQITPHGTIDENLRYSQRGILRSERIYGEGFQTSGGLRLARELTSALGIDPGAQVLDLGCGSGGTCLMMSDDYQANVLGIDRSEDSIAIAMQRSLSRKASVTFRCADFCEIDSGALYGDLVWASDVLMYVRDITSTFARMHSWVRKGGRVFGTDYCRAPGTLSSHFVNYTHACGMALSTSEEYEAALWGAGFEHVAVEDKTTELIQQLKDEHARLEKGKRQFLEEFSTNEFEYLLDRWRQKIEFCLTSNFEWVTFSGHRPI